MKAHPLQGVPEGNGEKEYVLGFPPLLVFLAFEIPNSDEEDLKVQNPTSEYVRIVEQCVSLECDAMFRVG